MPTQIAASTAYADVLAAYNACATGDTLEIPAGDSTWTSVLTVAKDIIISGVDSASTILRTAGTSIFTYANNIRTRLSGVGFFSSSASTSSNIISIRGLNNVIHDCRFEGTVTKVMGIRVSGGSGNPHPTGVIYDCQFYSARILVEGDLSSKLGRRIWANADVVAEIGTANTIFIEDCYLQRTINQGQNMIDSDFGGHLVARYNELVDCTIYGHPARNGGRGTKFNEIYNNAFTRDTLNPIDPPIWMRSGASVVVDNTITGTYAHANSLQLSCFDTVGAYPQLDQPGTGTDDALWVDPAPFPGQASSPHYESGNTRNGSPVHWAVKVGHESLIQSGRDFYNDTPKPGYTPYTYPHPLRGGSDPQSTDATLSALSLSSGTLSPAFSSGATTYTASVANGTTSITVTPTASDAGATITVNGVAVASGDPSGSIALAVGANVITIVVTAEAGNTSTTTVTVTRAMAPGTHGKKFKFRR